MEPDDIINLEPKKDGMAGKISKAAFIYALPVLGPIIIGSINVYLALKYSFGRDTPEDELASLILSIFAGPILTIIFGAAISLVMFWMRKTYPSIRKRALYILVCLVIWIYVIPITLFAIMDFNDSAEFILFAASLLIVAVLLAVFSRKSFRKWLYRDIGEGK